MEAEDGEPEFLGASAGAGGGELHRRDLNDPLEAAFVQLSDDDQRESSLRRLMRALGDGHDWTTRGSDSDHGSSADFTDDGDAADAGAPTPPTPPPSQAPT